ncbi:hypothetical protein CkaCkLH20_09428 [Colletotrichum karsti]|uniref:Uncharacterized protein n=1 Tax=Colletotrichum karsti TaxID=1095194 RepID=A0A9P6HWS4_9PEZI|nr:uncharacterized protein CkaCkLH20_09428 [Colletotrichum karsti]KAF9872918.1 hypothetical protein CkaCkLH20_09428 [Colletotrichum karsti]
MPHDPQLHSAFVESLPREVRDAVYLHPWRSRGLPPAHRSPWMNHWRCGERGFEKHGIEAIRGSSTSINVCWKMKKGKNAPDGPPSSVYLPMLLSCKLISKERLQSIRVDDVHLHRSADNLNVLRPLRPPPGHEDNDQTCPGFRAATTSTTSTGCVWIGFGACGGSTSGSRACGIDAESSFRGIRKSSSAGELKDVLAAFKTIGSVRLSTPLNQSIRPQKGYVDVGAESGVRVYKRGRAGDRFHPFLTLIDPECVFDRLIYTSRAESVYLFVLPLVCAHHVHHREVRLAHHDGTRDVMKDV